MLLRTIISAVAIAVLAMVVWLHASSLRDPRYLDGWVLATGCLIQVLFSIRRKLPLAPLGRVARWMQVHIYLGYSLVAVFLIHTGFAPPDGPLETALWSSFVILTLSGMAGSWITHSFPRRLTQNARHMDLMDIPAAQYRLARQADDLVLATGGEGSRSLTELHANTISRFLHGRHNLVSHLIRSGQPIRELNTELDSAEPFLSTKERDTLRSVRHLLVEKNALDDQYAHQLLLKGWLFAHVPATCAMVVLAVLHVVVAYAFSAGVP